MLLETELPDIEVLEVEKVEVVLSVARIPEVVLPKI